MSGAKFDSCRFLFSAFYLGLRISNKNKTRQCNNKQWKRTCIYLFSKQFFLTKVILNQIVITSRLNLHLTD